jgi:hypothetical protein
VRKVHRIRYNRKSWIPGHLDGDNMFLRQIRTYILMAIVLCIYGYFLYLPFRKESLNDVIVDFTRTAKTLQVDSPMYGSVLNDLLNQNVKLRGLFYNRFRDVKDPEDHSAYLQAQSMTHKIQLHLLILLLNHDLYEATKGNGSGELSSADCKKITALIDGLSANAGKADDLQKTSLKLMEEKGANLGGIYVLAHDMVLLSQMDDPINQSFFKIDLELLKWKEQQLLPVMGNDSETVYGQIRSSFVNDCVDDAIATLQQVTNLHDNGTYDNTWPYALDSYSIPSLPSDRGAAYVRMNGVDTGVQYRNYVYNVFTWEVPDGKYAIDVIRDGDFPWHATLQISQTAGIAVNLVRSDNTLLETLKPSIFAAFQQTGFSVLDLYKLVNEPEAVASYVELEQVIDRWKTSPLTHAESQYQSDIQPEIVIDQLQQLNDQFYSVVHGLNDSEQAKQRLIMNTLNRSEWEQAFRVWPAGNQGNPAKLDYNYMDVKAFVKSPTPTIYVTFAWITPDMHREAWNVVFQLIKGRYVITSVDTKTDLNSLQKLGKVFSYKTQNQTALLKSRVELSPEAFYEDFKDVLPSTAGDRIQSTSLHGH